MYHDLTIAAVLENELYTTPPLMPVIVANIIGTNKDIPRAFRLAKDVSTPDLKHLRRVRVSQDSEIECIISRLKSGDIETDVETELKQIEDKYSSEGLFRNYRVVYVPSSAPRTEHQWKACAKIWPCKFARSEYLIQCIEGSLFNDSERLVLKIIVNNALSFLKENSAKFQSAGVIFRCAKLFGVGLSGPSLIEANPTKHSTMMSIDSVATNADAGHWKCTGGDILSEAIQRDLDKQESLKDHRIDARFLPYLCTNYDVFVTEEPCMMCTMGLVQSRIRRLFYLDSKSVDMLTGCKQLCYPDGAIEKFQVHRDRSLNHRFEAWKISIVQNEL